MKGSLETKLGVFFALSAVAAVLLIELSGGIDVFQETYLLHADFKSVKQLKEGDPVKMAGVSIGRVASFDFVGDKVRVTMNINLDRKVQTDAIAGIQAYGGLVGANFVTILMGTAPSTFTIDGVMETEEAPDINVIMKKLNNVAGGIEGLTKSFNGDTIQNVLGPMTDFLKQNNPRITAILGDMQVVSSNLVAGRGTLGRFMTDASFYTASYTTMTNLNLTVSDARQILAKAQNSLDKATATFDEAQSIFGDLKLTLQGARATIDKVNSNEGSLGLLLNDDKFYSEITLSLSNLHEILEKINQGEGSAGKLVNDDSLYQNAKMTLQKLDKATEGLEDTGPLSILGTAVNKLF